MNEIVRSPAVIAGEINSIKQQTAVVLNGALTYAKRSCFEIGKRLEEAKSLVPHGEWGAWLAENCSYSETTARDMMRIYREYGDEQIDMITGRSDAETFEGLSQSQLVELFALPKPMRAAFVDEHREELESGNLSVRELREQIRSLKETLAEKDAEIKEEVGLYDKLLEEWREAQRENERLSDIEEEKEALEKELEALQNAPPQTQEITVTVHEPSAEQIEKIRTEALAEAEEKHKGDIERLSADLSKREAHHEQVIKEAQEAAEKKLRAIILQSDPHASRVSYCMEAIGRAIGDIDTEIRAMESETSGSGTKIRMQCETMLLRLLNKYGWQV